jgi:hypothetical protein
MADFMGFMSREVDSIGDVSVLHRRYLNPLLRDEGLKLLQFFVKRCSWGSKLPRASPIVGPPLDARSLLTDSVKEYVVELYLLQNLDELEALVGSGISEVYNQLYGYGGRYLDILAIHREGEKTLKATVIEIKADIEGLVEGLGELAHYMYWVSERVTKDPEVVLGLILTPLSGAEGVPFRDRAGEAFRPYGIDQGRVLWVGYDVAEGRLAFTPVV